MAWPITRPDLVGHLGTAPSGAADEAHADRCVAAAVEFVERHVPLPATGYGPSVELGAVMLAARWYARRGSPQGVVGYSDLGAAYVSRTDPDVARLLGLGRGSVG